MCTIAVLAVSACNTTGARDDGNWKCSADGLVNSQYDGSDYAMIHLAGYSKGGNYKVTKNPEGTEAKGRTRHGTPFTCVKTE